MRSDADIEDAMKRYGDVVLRACCANLSNRHDAEDAFQDTFLRYATKEVAFEGQEHRKAWLIRVAVNVCRDRMKKASAHDVPLEQIGVEHTAFVCEPDDPPDPADMAQALETLTPDQKMALLLAAVEGYAAPEIANMMECPVNTVYSHIARGKKKLREVLEDDGRTR